MPLRIVYAVAAIAIGIIGLGLDYHVISGLTTASAEHPVARSLPNMLVYYWSFLTHLSNLGLILVYLADITGWGWLGWFRKPVTKAGIAGIIALVMSFFHFMLAPHFHFTGELFYANYMLHYLTPVVFLIWWVAFAGHGTLRFRDVPMMLLPGVLYVAWVLLRGPFAGEYPYTILDPTFAPPGGQPVGYLGVGIGVVILVALVAIFDAVLVLIDGPLGRRAVPAPLFKA